ncbi:DUF3427 domain-containing protein [Rothia sp. 32237D007AR]
MSDKKVLPIGLYETLKTRRVLSQALPGETEWVESEIPGDDSEHVSSLARYVAQQVATKLEQTDAPERIALINSLLTHLEDETGPDEVLAADSPKKAGSIIQFTELKPRQQVRPSNRPTTPLNSVALLTNNPKEPQLGEEIKKELESADRVDLLCSFLKLTGVNVLAPQLDILKRRGIPLRVITTTYMGATDRKAVDKLVKEYGAQVKISYEKNSTRLHAKAWLFHRNTGFSTGYVGSSNLSHAALTDGLEWNVRISNTVTPGILGQFKAAFESYWKSHQFESYTGVEEDRKKLDKSLEQATIGTGASACPNLHINFSYVDVHPYPHQAIMLDELQSARHKGHHRNLAVAATGTGKTIFSALDYKRLCEEAGRKLRLLFVAHQSEILNQSRSAFATVMRDANFGEQYFGGRIPDHNEHVFATIQTLAGAGSERFAPEHFDVIIIDEFHHASAPSYQKILDYFQPQELIGLTATPERTDGKNVAAEYFDGRIATQLRLWDALEADLLVPFHYYGINDATDLSALTFERGSYRDSELSHYYLGNKRRVGLILQQIEEKIANPHNMRAIGFCVDTDHARYMAEEFNKAGIPATSLLGSDNAERRQEVIAQLKDPAHKLTTVFTVNLFNEGVDIPEVDTLLMLRPTQSPTLFQQQLGRGLRRSPDKAVLVVLDFVGNQARGFRFDLKMRSLTRSGVVTPGDIENPFLPPGCSIQLDKKTQQQVLKSIKAALNPKVEVLADNLKVFAEEQKKKNFEVVVTQLLEPYLERYGLELAHIYGRKTKNGKGLTFTFLLDQAGQIPRISGLYEKGSVTEHLSNRIKAFTNVNDEERVDTYQRLLLTDIWEKDLSMREKRFAWMLLFSFWPNGKIGDSKEKFTLDQGLGELRQHPYFIQELLQIWAYRLGADRHAPQPSSKVSEDIPLRTHAYYSREEIFAAIGLHENEKRSVPAGAVQGVYESRATNTIALLVNLSKSEKHFTPETMYRDYAVTEREFAWDSQNSTASESRLGRIYQHHGQLGQVPLLFVRYTKEDGIGTAPYLFVGSVTYRSHSGSQPMHIKWDLERPLPADLFALARSTA